MQTRNAITIVLAIVMMIAAPLSAGPVASPGVWAAGGIDTKWDTALNWDITPDHPDGAGATATFTDIASGGVAYVVDLNGLTLSVDDLIFSSISDSFSIGGTGSLAVTNLNHTATTENTISGALSISSGAINVSNGALNLTNTANAINAATTVTVSGTGTLSAQGTTGVVDASSLGDADITLSGGTVQLSVGGYSGADSVVSIVETTAQNNTGFTVSTTDAVEGITPVGTGTFGLWGTSSDLNVLSNGAFGSPTMDGAPLEVVTISNNATLTYTLANPGVAVDGIDVYTGWNDSGRDNPRFDVSYSTSGDPDTFTALHSTNYAAGIQDAAVYLTGTGGGAIALDVAKLRFAFPSQENNYVGYREIDVSILSLMILGQL